MAPQGLQIALISPLRRWLSGVNSVCISMTLSANQLISNTPQSTWVEVLVDCPGAQDLYTYRLPPDLPVNPGDILSVPFGGRVLGGIAICLLSQLPPDLDPSRIRTVETIINRGFFSQAYWDLLRQVADYYQTPLIQVIRTALPPGLLAKSQRRIRLKSERIPPEGDTFVGPSARHLLELLKQSKTGDYTWQHLQKQGKGARQGLQQLLKRGWVESYLAHPQPPHPKLRQAVTLATAPDVLSAPLNRSTAGNLNDAETARRRSVAERRLAALSNHHRNPQNPGPKGIFDHSTPSGVADRGGN